MKMRLWDLHKPWPMDKSFIIKCFICHMHIHSVQWNAKRRGSHLTDSAWTEPGAHSTTLTISWIVVISPEHLLISKLASPWRCSCSHKPHTGSSTAWTSDPENHRSWGWGNVGWYRQAGRRCTESPDSGGGRERWEQLEVREPRRQACTAAAGAQGKGLKNMNVKEIMRDTNILHFIVNLYPKPQLRGSFSTERSVLSLSYMTKENPLNLWHTQNINQCNTIKWFFTINIWDLVK